MGDGRIFGREAMGNTESTFTLRFLSPYAQNVDQMRLFSLYSMFESLYIKRTEILYINVERSLQDGCGKLLARDNLCAPVVYIV